MGGGVEVFGVRLWFFRFVLFRTVVFSYLWFFKFKFE